MVPLILYGCRQDLLEHGCSTEETTRSHREGTSLELEGGRSANSNSNELVSHRQIFVLLTLTDRRIHSKHKTADWARPKIDHFQCAMYTITSKKHCLIWVLWPSEGLIRSLFLINVCDILANKNSLNTLSLRSFGSIPTSDASFIGGRNLIRNTDQLWFSPR